VNELEGVLYLPVEAMKPKLTLYGENGKEHLTYDHGKVYIDGQETSDVERIGAAFMAWVHEWAAAQNKGKPHG
jgi:hypothetical protein